MKVQITVLCGPERHFWINPELAVALVHWSHDERIEVFHQDHAYEFTTSQEARNVACEKFMANPEFDSPDDCLIMVDNDTNPVNPKAGVLNNFMDLPLMRLPIVGCPVPVIRRSKWMLNAVYEEGDFWRPMAVDELSSPEESQLVKTDVGPAIKVDAVGFGAVCIQRSVLEEFREQHTFSVSDGNEVKRWDRELVVGNHLPYVLRWRDDRGASVKGEDFLFCRRAKELGLQTYVSPHHYCGHLHSYDYGRLPELSFAIRKGEAKKGTEGESRGKPRRQLTPADYSLEGPCLPITEWAIEPELAAWLRRRVADFKRRSVSGDRMLELGSGISTLVILDELLKQGIDCRSPHPLLHSLEHNVQHYDSLLQVLTLRGVSAAGLIRCPLVDGFYDTRTWRLAQDGYCLLLIDGPPAHEAPGGREKASTLFPRLRKGAWIILDDADREGEQSALRNWTQKGLVEFVERMGRAAILKKI